MTPKEVQYHLGLRAKKIDALVRLGRLGAAEVQIASFKMFVRRYLPKRFSELTSALLKIDLA